jgi:hypothetical protein
MDIKRKPSEYVKDHIKLTTQPLDYPETRPNCCGPSSGWSARRSCCSLGLPALDVDDPRWLVKHLPSTPARR